jgi:hypothetical protein
VGVVRLGLTRFGERDMLGEIKRDGGSAEDIPSSQVRMAKVDGLERSLRLSVGYKYET